MKETQGAHAAPNERIRAPRGMTLSCKGWGQEAALRMLMNSVDPEVAERPGELRFQGGNSRAADDWDCFRAIVASLRELENDQTLLLHCGRPLAIFRTELEAPRVVLANAFSGWQLTSELGAGSADVSRGNISTVNIPDREPFTAGNWMYVGTQSTLQNAFDLFGSVALQHFGGSLAGRLVTVCGLGARGGAQPLAAALNGAAVLGIDADAERIKRRVKTGYCDLMVNDLDEALRILKNAVRQRVATSVGLIGNCAALVPELARRGVLPDVVMNTVEMNAEAAGEAGLAAAASDALAYIPRNFTVEQAADLLHRDADAYREQALDSIAEHVRGLLALQRFGAVVLDCGDGLRALAYHFRKDGRGVREAFDIPGLASAEEGRSLMPDGPSLISDAPSSIPDNGVAITCVALSGAPGDITRVDRLLLEICQDDADLQRWIPLVKKHVRFQGLPARACRLEFAKLGEFMSAVNDLVARGEFQAPVVIAENDVADPCANSRFRALGESGLPRGREPATSHTNSETNSDNGAAAVIGTVLESEGSAAWISIIPAIDGGREEGDGRNLRIWRTMVADGTRETAARVEREQRSTGNHAIPPIAPQRFVDNATAAGLLRDRLVRVVMP
jgi:urocanate hydratase